MHTADETPLKCRCNDTGILSNFEVVQCGKIATLWFGNMRNVLSEKYKYPHTSTAQSLPETPGNTESMWKNTLRKLELKRYKKAEQNTELRCFPKRNSWHFYCIYCTVKWRGNITVRWWVWCPVWSIGVARIKTGGGQKWTNEVNDQRNISGFVYMVLKSSD